MRLNWNLWEFPAQDDHNPCKRWLCNFHSSVSGGNFLSRIFIEIHFASCMLLKVHFWDVFLSSRSHRLSWIIRVRWALDGALSIIHSMEYLTRVELIDQLETLIKHENEARYSRFRSPVVNFCSSTRYFFYSALFASLLWIHTRSIGRLLFACGDRWRRAGHLLFASFLHSRIACSESLG